MVSRREFVRDTAALAALVALPLHALAPRPASAAAGQSRAVPLIVDRSFAAAAAFARAGAARGQRVRLFDGDLGGLWLHEIEPRWRNAQLELAGATGAGVLFFLETLAADYGASVVHRAEHVAPPDSADPALYSWVIARDPRGRPSLAANIKKG